MNNSLNVQDLLKMLEIYKADLAAAIEAKIILQAMVERQAKEIEELKNQNE